ncbi:MAG: hypothetical protein HFG42_13970 [Lachnospiraceae bacterium]|nr:hypothetical protein [Lachnospiraceae bacterium]
MGDYAIPEIRLSSQITIPTEEYKELVKIQARVEVFKEFVNSKKYSVDKEECAAFLGFKLKNQEEPCTDADI